MPTPKHWPGFIPLAKAYEIAVAALEPAARPSDEYLMSLDEEAADRAYEEADAAERRAEKLFRHALVYRELSCNIIADTDRILFHPRAESFRKVDGFGFPGLFDLFHQPDLERDLGGHWTTDNIYLADIAFRLWLKAAKGPSKPKAS